MPLPWEGWYYIYIYSGPPSQRGAHLAVVQEDHVTHHYAHTQQVRSLQFRQGDWKLWKIGRAPKGSRIVFQSSIFRCFSGLWLNQPIWKNMLVKIGIFPNFRGENKKCLKPPPSFAVSGATSSPLEKLWSEKTTVSPLEILVPFNFGIIPSLGCLGRYAISCRFQHTFRHLRYPLKGPGPIFFTWT